MESRVEVSVLCPVNHYSYIRVLTESRVDGNLTNFMRGGSDIGVMVI